MAKFINGVTDYETWRDHTKDSGKYLARVALIEAGIQTLADEVKLVNAVNVSTMGGKLEGYYSVSTSVLMNPICQERAKVPGSICAQCYAATYAAMRNELNQALETNFRILNEFLISETAWATLTWPTTNGDGRIESFGDVASVICARNYLRIIKTHPWINFGVWTKNVALWIRAFALEGGKPANMKFIVSSPKINEKVEISAEWLPYLDHRFTVYDAEFARENGIVINCGGAKCATCRNCYGEGPFDVCEILK